MINALSVTSECVPLIKTGGLADVTGALPRALKKHNIVVRTLLPGYPAVLKALKSFIGIPNTRRFRTGAMP